MLKVNTSAVLFSLGMIFAGASEAAEVKYQPIDNAESLTKMCSEENRPFLQDMDKNWSTLYKFKTDDQRDTFDRTIRPAMVNSCVAYMAINSVDYSKVEGDGVDYSRNDKAMEKWFAGYKDKLHSQLKELQALPKVQEQHRKEMAQREAGKKVAAEEARQEQAQNVKVYKSFDALMNPTLKAQIVKCEAEPDAARVIAKMKSDMAQASRDYKNEVQFLRDNGYDGVTAHRQADARIMAGARAVNKFDNERAGKIINKCLIANYGWKYI